MDLLAELESMAVNVIEEENVSDVDVQRWQKLFNLTYSDAFTALEEYRRDFSRIRIANELWDAVRFEKQMEGHDRELFEYSLSQPRNRDLSWRPGESGLFIARLAGPLNTPETIQEAAALDKIPPVVDGVGEMDKRNSARSTALPRVDYYRG